MMRSAGIVAVARVQKMEPEINDINSATLQINSFYPEFADYMEP